MKLPDGEVTPQQLREIHDTYGLHVYQMAVRIHAARSVLRRVEKDPEVRDAQRREARAVLRDVIAEGERHGLLRETNGEVWLIPPKLETRATSPAETRAAPAEPPIGQEALMTLLQLATEALAGLREARDRATPDGEWADGIVIRAAQFAADSAQRRALDGLGSIEIVYGPDGRPQKFVKSDGTSLVFVYDRLGRLSRLDRGPTRLDA